MSIEEGLVERIAEMQTEIDQLRAETRQLRDILWTIRCLIADSTVVGGIDPGAKARRPA